MYKVFVNDKPIIFTSSLKKENDFPVYIFKTIVIDEVIYKLKEEKIKGINLYSPDLKTDWLIFKKKFNLIVAAGGLVINPERKILFIYRANKWDLPKGKIEKNESIEAAATREVEEECGITNLKIKKFLLTTYHIFYHKQTNLKETHWFLMNSTYSDTLTPQLEEGITEAVFKSESDIKETLKKSYANIQLVYDSYTQSKK